MSMAAPAETGNHDNQRIRGRAPGGKCAITGAAIAPR